MRLLRSLAGLATALTPLAGATETIISDSFEAATLSPAWTVETNNDGRARTTDAFGATDGQRALVLDDAVDDAVDSLAAATIAVDITGYRDITLSYTAKSLGNEPHPPEGAALATGHYDGVAISIEGAATWWPVDEFSSLTGNWGSRSVPLDGAIAQLGGASSRRLLVRFSAYDNSAAPLDGIAFDNVVVTGVPDLTVSVELPPTAPEGATGLTGHILLSHRSPTDLRVALSQPVPHRLSLPQTVTVPGGTLRATFPFSVPDDDVARLSQHVPVTPLAGAWNSAPGRTFVIDDEQPGIDITAPESIVEGSAPVDATITLDRPATVPVLFLLDSDPPDRLFHTDRISIPPGETSARFPLSPRANQTIEGDITVTLTATGNQPGIGSVDAAITLVDTTPATIRVVATDPLYEGHTGTLRVVLGGDVTVPTRIDLTPGSADLEVPPVAIVPAGSSVATVPVTVRDNTDLDGSRTYALSLSAQGLETATATLDVHDDDPAAITVSPFGDFAEPGTPLTTTVSAVDIDGNTIAVDGSELSLSVLGDQGSSPTQPPNVRLVGGTWTGPVTLPDHPGAALVLLATHPGGYTGRSAPFDPMLRLPFPASDLLWDAGRGRIYASVPWQADGPFANAVVAIDPATRQVTATVPTGGNPGQLALTADASTLYVTLGDNGQVAVIDTATMETRQFFAIGSHPINGTLFASDIATVPGRPDRLVVARRTSRSFRSGEGVAVYQDGLPLPSVTPGNNELYEIEPSTDPTVLFAHDGRVSPPRIQRIAVSDDGASLLTETPPGSLPFDATGLHADGDILVATNSMIIDGLTSRNLGSFPRVPDLVPDVRNGRTYVLETGFPANSPVRALAAYNHASLTTPARLSFPPGLAANPTGFIRWGAAGLAFATERSVVLLPHSRLVPAGAATDLAVAVRTAPATPRAGEPFTYYVDATNRGTSPARSPVLSLSLGPGHTLAASTSSHGTASVDGRVATLAFDQLAPGATATLEVTATPDSSGALAFTAAVLAGSPDPSPADNTADGTVHVGYRLRPFESVGYAINATHLVADTARDRLWLSIEPTDPGELAGALVSLDPATGSLSGPLRLPSPPTVLAVAPDGRFLYAGTDAAQEIYRVDLDSGTHDLTIPLGDDPAQEGLYARAIHGLPGDGTSILVSRYNRSGAPRNQGLAVYDGDARRPLQDTGPREVSHFASTLAPGTYAGASSFGDLAVIEVVAAGVRVDRVVPGLASVDGTGMASHSNRLLTGFGRLVDTSTFTVFRSLGQGGSPLIDPVTGELYLLSGTKLNRFRPSGSPNGSLDIPEAPTTPKWSTALVRWGEDGFAALGSGTLVVARWPSDVDADGNGLSDVWERRHFGSTGTDPAGDPDGDRVPNLLEHNLATPPHEHSPLPFAVGGEVTANPTGLRLHFTRRRGTLPRRIVFDVSRDLITWERAPAPTELVRSQGWVGGVATEEVEVLFPTLPLGRGYLRLVAPLP